jgi:hypothetical protein
VRWFYGGEPGGASSICLGRGTMDTKRKRGRKTVLKKKKKKKKKKKNITKNSAISGMSKVTHH